MKKRATNQIYIAYGSNMDLGQMEYRCPGARVIGKTTLDGWRLAFMGRPGNAHATILPDPGSRTPVVVWGISERNEAALDIYEGVRGGYYYKEYLTVTVDGTTYEDALVYIMSDNPYNHPHPQYVKGILRGYRDAGIPVWPVYQALNDAVSMQGQIRQIRKGMK